MKKQMLFLIGGIVVLASALCELALHNLKEVSWTNYTLLWDAEVNKQKKIRVSPQ